MYHFKPKAVPPFLIPRELFWETRRDLSFKKQFELAKRNTHLIKVEAYIFEIINFYRSQKRNFLSYQPNCDKMSKLLLYRKKMIKKYTTYAEK